MNIPERSVELRVTEEERNRVSPLLVTNLDLLREQTEHARQFGMVIFVDQQADPHRLSNLHPFFYVYSQAEMMEKVRLLEADPSILRHLGL